MTTPIERFSRDENYTFEVPEQFLNKVCKSEIVNIVLDWYKQKAAAEDQAQIRKLNKAAGKKLLRSDKFIDCNSRKRRENFICLRGRLSQSGISYCKRPTNAGSIYYERSSIEYLWNVASTGNEESSILGYGKYYWS